MRTRDTSKPSRKTPPASRLAHKSNQNSDGQTGTCHRASKRFNSSSTLSTILSRAMRNTRRHLILGLFTTTVLRHLSTYRMPTFRLRSNGPATEAIIRHSSPSVRIAGSTTRRHSRGMVTRTRVPTRARASTSSRTSRSSSRRAAGMAYKGQGTEKDKLRVSPTLTEWPLLAVDGLRRSTQSRTCPRITVRWSFACLSGRGRARARIWYSVLRQPIKGKMRAGAVNTVSRRNRSSSSQLWL